MRKCPHGEMIYQNGNWESQPNQTKQHILDSGAT